METIPLDLLKYALSFIGDPYDFARSKRVCKLWNNVLIGQEKDFWRNQYLSNSLKSGKTKVEEELHRAAKNDPNLYKELYLHYVAKLWKKNNIDAWTVGQGTYNINVQKPVPGGFGNWLIGKFSFVTKSGQQKTITALINGLDAAGKTTLLYKLKCEITTTIPTIGFNVETASCRNFNFIVWDVGGPDKIRPLWRHYYTNVQAIIWCVDSNDGDRLEECSYELEKSLNEKELAPTDTNNMPLLVFANKQDLPNAMSSEQVAERLGLDRLISRKWFVQSSCNTSGDGILEGLDWLLNNAYPQ